MNSVTGNDTRPDRVPVYAYVLRHLGTLDASLFLTQYDQEFEVESFPAGWGADDPQLFRPANLSHGEITREGNFDKTTFQVSGITEQMGTISQYALTGAIPKIRVDVIKISSGPVLSGEIVNWADHCQIVQSGLVSQFAFQGQRIAVECVPEPLFGGLEIPRCRWSRSCNHQLYGTGCKVDPVPFSLTANVSAITIAERRVLISDIHASEAGNYFRQGVFTHQETGMIVSVSKSEIQGLGTLLTLTNWIPELEVGDVITVKAGCDHLFGTCGNKFSNAKNFGGFSGVPGVNPSVSGI